VKPFKLFKSQKNKDFFDNDVLASIN